jgi:hypothetical protein
MKLMEINIYYLILIRDYSSYRLPFDVHNVFKNVPNNEMIDQGENDESKIH